MIWAKNYLLRWIIKYETFKGYEINYLVKITSREEYL